MKNFKRIITLCLALALCLSCAPAVFAAEVADATIDMSRKGSLTVYKYDLTNAEKDGVWDSSYVSTGVMDQSGVVDVLGGKRTGDTDNKSDLGNGEADNSALLKAKELAIAYNEAIIPGASDEAYSQAALLEASVDYESQLNIAGNGTMGYVEIPKINVNLPIYHGTGNDSLERGVGHLLGSSLPVGGESTHAILTGHSGMATQKMFTDLEQLAIGDVFYLHILDETLAYQVIELNVVLPHDTSLLGITPGKDHCTLVTCTPFGVNTHRLLVRGTRIPYEEAEEIMEQQPVIEEPISTWEEKYMDGIITGICIVAILAILAGVVWIVRRK